MSEEKDDIGKILSDFKTQKEQRETPIEPLDPPKRRENYIDFAKSDDEDTAEKQPKKKKEPKPKKTPEELEAIRAAKKEKRDRQKKKNKTVLTKVKKAVFNKKMLIALVVIIALIGIIFGVLYAVEQSKGAYLKPYEKKYPDAEFQIGMLEKYCDILGENPDTAGYLEIPDIELKTAVSSDSKKSPYAEKCTEGAEQFNHVVYLNDNSLENLYSSAAAYNNSAGYMMYSNLFEDYTFKVAGAFYTNTKAEDDDGYIFPYNVTEKMTVKSANDYVSKLESRFLYDTGVNVTRQDTVLTISCPTDYRKNFRFVVVAVLRDDAETKTKANEKSDINYPKIVFDELKKDSPYKFATKWYPEIIITDSEGNEKTVQKTIEHYK